MASLGSDYVVTIFVVSDPMGIFLHGRAVYFSGSQRSILTPALYFWGSQHIFNNLKLELLTQFPASNKEKNSQQSNALFFSTKQYIPLAVSGPCQQAAISSPWIPYVMASIVTLLDRNTGLSASEPPGAAVYVTCSGCLTMAQNVRHCH